MVGVSWRCYGVRSRSVLKLRGEEAHGTSLGASSVRAHDRYV